MLSYQWLSADVDVVGDDDDVDDDEEEEVDDAGNVVVGPAFEAVVDFPGKK